MTDEQPKYETRTVKSVRGMEARTRTRWEQDGWELLSMTQGRLQSRLEFRRAKKQIGRRTLVAAGAGAAVLVVVIVLGASGVFGGEEDAPAEAKAPTASAESASGPRSTAGSQSEIATPSPTATSAAIITAENSPPFAALLQLGDYCDGSIAAFADENEGRTIRFDGSISAMSPHDGATTRYDVLLAPGDGGVEATRGPAFQFNDVNTVSDLHYVGDVPDGIGPGTRLTVTATVDEYLEQSCHFHLTPVETAFR